MNNYELPKQCCLLTIDVETHSIWHNCLRDETGERVLKEGMPVLIELLAKYNINTTFFLTGYIAEKFPEIVRMILLYGHEVGCHGLNHKPEEAFDVLTLKQQSEHLKKAKDILENVSGREVVSFRAPALRVNQFTPIALNKNGFKIDSSVSSQRCDGFFSFGGMKKMKWLIAPRLPYLTKENNLYRRGNGPIIEVPISALIIPYIGTTLRIIPRTTKMIRHILNWESQINKKPIVFDIHPNEFLNEENGRRKITRRSKNFVSYLFSDLIRSKLKVKNLGKAAIPLFEEEINFFANQNYQFLSVFDYCRKAGFSV